MSNTDTFQVIGYGRKSVSEDGSVSISAQQSEVQKWCDARGYELVAFYSDDGISGATLEREGFQTALKHLDSIKGSNRALVSYSLSRISRSTSDALKLAKQLDSRGIALVTVAEQIDRSTPQGMFQFEVMCSVNALEREIGRARTKTAMKEMKKQGRRISRFAPYGYDFKGDKVVENPKEQSNIKKMVALRNAKNTLDEIVGWTAKNGVATKNGGGWTRATIARIIKRAG